jgi:Ca2+-binding EF-hand superfamily protein
VETEFPTYDADKNGELSQSEFSTWVLALHSKAEETGSAAKKDEAAKAKWAKDAFASADADKNKKVSKTEISKFLLG